ncbi:GNAT family N-acetyltransferase [Marinoscillum furvescens]|uniref:N-acetyltransferase domain-containing protein n=1 Tax=Marinoscillum furvescens DSM 4134 TaxID=1122208 RepID=A0A3D9L7R2_MARFU|nr:GNAT family N-acetyltransferase [Marinoscillum furvescens]REE00517.1 hypothetical protein C7460_105140 [Marinoscillum furvescens DSM 4134]
MSKIKNNLKIQHDILSKIFYIKVKGGNAELHYDRHGDSYLDLLSTTVPDDSQGFGIASQIVEAALAFAREQHLKVKPTCDFVESYIEKHPEHSDLVL